METDIRVLLLGLGTLILFDIVKEVGDKVDGFIGNITPYFFALTLFVLGYYIIRSSTELKIKKESDLK